MSTPDIKALISIVKTGTRQEVKQAQKAIESAWHHYYIPHRKEGKKAFEAFLPEIGTFDQIADIDHQAHFISSLKWAFWTIGEEYFEIWAAFVLKYIQHPSGKIRQSILHISDVLVISLRDRDDFASGQNNLSAEEMNIKIKVNLQRFGRLVMAVEDLLQRYYEPRFKRYKYIGSMPSSVYKSLQILITEKLLRGKSCQNRYAQFLQEMKMERLRYVN